MNEPDPKLNESMMARIFLPFAFGYYLSYLYRVVNAVIAPNLVADMGVDPSDLGLLTAAYFLTFAAFQLPLGCCSIDSDPAGSNRSCCCLPRWALPVWMLFGFLGTSGIICYAVLSQNFPIHLCGRANTALNLMVFVVAFIALWAMGAVIELWPVTAQGGYDPAGYRVAFGAMPALQILALIWFFLIGRKVTYA